MLAGNRICANVCREVTGVSRMDGRHFVLMGGDWQNVASVSSCQRCHGIPPAAGDPRRVCAGVTLKNVYP